MTAGPPDARVIWERLGRGDSVEAICRDLPPSQHQAVREVADQLLARLDATLDEVNAQFVASLRRSLPEFAGRVEDSPHRAVLLALFEGRDPVPLIWEELKP